LADEISEKLKDWGGKHDVKVEIWRHSGIGNKIAHNGPDLLVGINDWRCVILKDQFEGELFEQRPYSPRHTGSHRMNGIFIAAGPDILRKKLDQVHICDVAPTLLYMFDQPIPTSMDGRVLKKIFKPEYLKNHPLKLQTEIQAKKGAEPRKISSGLSEEEEKAIQKRLKDLGYM
jgi:predicted AlkP superfamily phosphohydrolase/phosphomutase